MVQTLHERLEETMRNADTLGIQGRYRKLEPQLMESYDFGRMIAVAAGSHWRQAGEPERQELLNAFSRFSVATYASRFNGYSGEHFETVNERQGPRQTVLVDTRLIRPDADPIPITYVMRANNGQWQIVDVLLEGTISELAVKRSEYATILGHGGIAELTEVLKEKTAALLSDKSG
ncbi:MAG: ABC transporter substrate-binding protein [Hyphomicrobiales bacterium]|nr:ABC transporter substrate-binding protein [Hyphomicrobiales bacterium]